MQMILTGILLMVVVINVIFMLISPTSFLRVIMCFCAIESCWTIRLIYNNILLQERVRSKYVWLRWFLVYIMLISAASPLIIFIYSQMDWSLFSQYALEMFYICYMETNIIVPLLILLLLTITFWYLVIISYQKSYISYLCYNKIIEIYGK